MGIVSSSINQSFPPASKFSTDDIPDLTGKVVIVTGANAGIGKETAKALLQHDAKVYLGIRNPDKARQAIDDLKQQTGREAIFLKLDLSDLQSVKAAADEFIGKEKELHILFNNAGVMAPPVEQVTAQGYDLQFGTNVLGHFYLTKLLLPVLLETAKKSPDRKVRVVNTTSMSHLVARSLNFNTFKDGPARIRLGTHFLYSQSKYGNIVFSNELARRYGDHGIVSSSVHPGGIQSDIWRHIPRPVTALFNYLILYPATHGALTQLYAGTSPEGATFNGKYLIPWARVGKAAPSTDDPELGKQLWTWLEEQVEKL